MWIFWLWNKKSKYPFYFLLLRLDFRCSLNSNSVASDSVDLALLLEGFFAFFDLLCRGGSRSSTSISSPSSSSATFSSASKSSSSSPSSSCRRRWWSSTAVSVLLFFFAGRRDLSQTVRHVTRQVVFSSVTSLGCSEKLSFSQDKTITFWNLIVIHESTNDRRILKLTSPKLQTLINPSELDVVMSSFCFWRYFIPLTLLWWAGKVTNFSPLETLWISTMSLSPAIASVSS